jgi:hypothetical protein
VRDDFPKLTITEIAKGVGYRCSNPDCGRPTVGANAAQDGIITIGVAAHIRAASPGGPRFDPAQSRETRRRTDNGIWLCQSCGKLVDADPERFTVEVLVRWKREAQDRAFRELVAPEIAGRNEEAERIGSIVAADNKSIEGSDFDELVERLQAGAVADLAAYKRAPIWSGGTVELTLRLYDDQNAPPFSISKLPAALEVAPQVTIVAPPGTGKTTTLLQLAAHALATGAIIPLYFRLGDWSLGSSGLLASLHQRPAFQDVSASDVRKLAEQGKVLLLLDGWNELDAATRRNLRIEIEQTRRDYPYLRIIATTRQQMLDLPLSGPRISIEPLSEDQEMAIAQALSGAAGEKIVDNAWRTPGVRELIAAPLYLSALVSADSQDSSPTTKEEVLRLFVQQHERASDHAEALQRALFGRHAEVLTALASHLNTAGSTTMTDADARLVVTTAIAQLREQGQISGHPEPLAVLEVLTSHHTLTRSGAANGAIAFQHQQFQEFYASHEVAKRMRAHSKGDRNAHNLLRAAVFDQPIWEESILFAVERISRESDGAAVVAHAVRLALPIDPMLAAEMIYRASPAVWEIVKAEILSFVDRWHQPGTVDRAVRFMIMTGRPEFEARVWPLASSADSQILLPTLRTASRFRATVLGPDLGSKIAGLPEKTREHLLASIASKSSVDGMDLATELAKADPSPKVQSQVVQALQFRRADRHVATLLAGAHDETWALVAKRGYAEEIRDPATAERVRAERDKALALATAPTERLNLLLEQSSDYPGRDTAIAAAIADAGFAARDQYADSSLYFAQQRAPAAVLRGLRQRLEAGLELPFHAYDLLAQMEVTDEGPIASAILDASRDDRHANAISVMAGQKTVGALVDKFLACAAALKTARNDHALSDEYHRLRSRIAGTRAASFVVALMARADTDDLHVITSLGSLVSSHGGTDSRKAVLPVDPSLKLELMRILRNWVEVAVSSPISDRYQLNEVSNAIARFGFRELIPELKRLLDEDLARLKTARDAMRYGNQYREAFSRVGGNEAAAAATKYLEDRAFGFDAALILKAISDKELNVAEPSFNRPWPCFDEVTTARADRALSPKPPPANAFAVPIFEAINRLAKPETDKEGQLLAIKLARIALSMPHSDQDALIARVMALPQPPKAKCELFTAMTLNGQVLDAAVIMQGVDEWLEETANDAWHKKQNTWEIEPWLELLPFTNRPEAVIEGLEKVKAFYGRDYAQRWERVLNAVAAVPGDQGKALLASLARAHKDIAGNFEWMKAILGRNSPAAVRLYIDLVTGGVFESGSHSFEAWHTGRELAPYVQKFPQLKAELKREYESVGTGSTHAMLEHLFGEIGDEDTLIAMVKKYAASGQSYDGLMERVVRAVTLREVPVSEGSAYFNIYPAPVASLRKSLFGLLDGALQEAALATSCLNAIDSLRDEYGIAANDPRHPDVASDKPWPTAAGQA